MLKNLIYLAKAELAGIDTILPILMEIKEPRPNIIIVLRSDRHLKVANDNRDIWEVIQALKIRVYVIQSKNSFTSAFRLINFLLSLFFKENIIIKEGDVFPYHKIIIKILKRFSRVTEIKDFLRIQSFDYAKNVQIQRAFSRKRSGKSTESNIFNGDYDHFLSTISPDRLKEIAGQDVPEKKIVEVGYTRRFPQWQNFINKAIEENEVINGKYFLYVLRHMGKRCGVLDEPSQIELLEESLEVFKKYSGKIKTVFKPHPRTNVRDLDDLLKKINYSNYVIDYSHPFVLSSKAKFVFGNAYSCVMFDAYYQGRPVVEYCQYDPEFFARIGRKSLGGRHCDFFIHRDKKKLDEVLDKLINGSVKVERDPDLMRSSYPDTPLEFYDFWHKQLVLKIGKAG